MDEARAMLDELMGKTRDLTEDIKKNVRQTHFSDDEVCKDYLCGVCPHLLFTTTKSDLGKCPMPICGNPDAEECKRQYDRLSQEEKDKYGYDHKLMLHLERLLQQCDRRVAKNRDKAAEQMAISEEDVIKIAALRKQIQDGIDKSEAAAAADNIDNSMAFLNQADQAKDTMEKIMHPYNDKQIMVCEVSGNFISNKDNDERMRAHFEGKQYMGWKTIRDTYAALKARRPPPGTISSRTSDRERDNRSRRSSSRNNTSSRYQRRSSRDRSRDRGPDRPRDRPRDRDRDADRYRRRDPSPRRRDRDSSRRNRSRSPVSRSRRSRSASPDDRKRGFDRRSEKDRSNRGARDSRSRAVEDGEMAE